MREQRRMIVFDERLLHQGSPFGIPLERHHISEIICRRANSVTCREIDQISAPIFRIFRMEKVPRMRVAMNKCVSFNRGKAARPERRQKLHRLLTSFPPIWREPVAKSVNKRGKTFPYEPL